MSPPKANDVKPFMPAKNFGASFTFHKVKVQDSHLLIFPLLNSVFPKTQAE